MLNKRKCKNFTENQKSVTGSLRSSIRYTTFSHGAVTFPSINYKKSVIFLVNTLVDCYNKHRECISFQCNINERRINNENQNKTFKHRRK